MGLLSLRWLLTLFLSCAVLWLPGEAMACIPGLQWGMDSSIVEQRLEVSLGTARSAAGNDSSAVYRVNKLHIGDLPVEQLDLRFGSKGLNQLVYSLQGCDDRGTCRPQDPLWVTGQHHHGTW